MCECVRWQTWTSAGTSIPASYMLSSGPDSVLMLQPDSAADGGTGGSLIYGDVTQADNTRTPEDTLAEGHCRLSAHRTATFLSALMKKTTTKNHIVSIQTSKEFFK